MPDLCLSHDHDPETGICRTCGQTIPSRQVSASLLAECPKTPIMVRKDTLPLGIMQKPPRCFVIHHDVLYIGTEDGVYTLVDNLLTKIIGVGVAGAATV